MARKGKVLWEVSRELRSDEADYVGVQHYALREDGVLLGASGGQRIRAVTHLDVDRDGVLRAAQVIADIASKL